LILRGRALLSHAWSNAGLVVLQHTLIAAPQEIPSQMAAQVEVLLQRALAWDKGNQRAHLGLGTVYILSKRPQYALREWDEVVSPENSEAWERSLWYRSAQALKPGLNEGVTEEWYRGDYFILDSFSSTVAWQSCSWCGNVEGCFGTSHGVLEMSYRNTPGERDKFAFRSVLNAPIRGFSNLLLRLRGEPGTLLTMEIGVDGERSRPLNYQPVPEAWDVWTIPVDGKFLDEVMIGIGERDPVPMPEEYRLFIDWIALR
jgi:hypothetical protein